MKETTQLIINQFALTVKRSAGQIMFLYGLCGKNFNRLISLMETLEYNKMHFCPITSEDVSNTLKLKKDNRYNYYRATLDYSVTGATMLVINHGVGTGMTKQYFTVPGAKKKIKGKEYKYSIEIFNKGEWEEEVKYFSFPVSLKHVNLCEVLGQRRNPQCLEINRFDLLTPTNAYVYGYKLERKEPGLLIPITNGDVHLLT